MVQRIGKNLPMETQVDGVDQRIDRESGDNQERREQGQVGVGTLPVGGGLPGCGPAPNMPCHQWVRQLSELGDLSLLKLVPFVRHGFEGILGGYLSQVSLLQLGPAEDIPAR